MASAGARKTIDGPCIKGNLVPKDVCKRVVTPDTKSTVETTLDVSSCTQQFPSDQIIQKIIRYIKATEIE